MQWRILLSGLGMFLASGCEQLSGKADETTLVFKATSALDADDIATCFQQADVDKAFPDLKRIHLVPGRLAVPEVNGFAAADGTTIVVTNKSTGGSDITVRSTQALGEKQQAALLDCVGRRD